MEAEAEARHGEGNGDRALEHVLLFWRGGSKVDQERRSLFLFLAFSTNTAKLWFLPKYYTSRWHPGYHCSTNIHSPLSTLVSHPLSPSLVLLQSLLLCDLTRVALTGWICLPVNPLGKSALIMNYGSVSLLFYPSSFSHRKKYDMSWCETPSSSSLSALIMSCCI